MMYLEKNILIVLPMLYLPLCSCSCRLRRLKESSPFSHAAVAATWCRLLILFAKALLVDLAIPTPNANGGFLL
jgi:hypothetical protein